MLSRAQEGRVREILGHHSPGTIQLYCPEHLAAAAQISAAHLADLAAFVRRLRAHGACRSQFGGTCGSGGHATASILVAAGLNPPRPEAGRAS